VNAAGGAFGVLIGGVLTEYAGWRWVMFVNVPMAAGALALTARAITREPPRARTGRLDVAGAVLGTAGIGLLVFGVVRTDQYAWTSAVTGITLVIAAALLAAFIYVERSVAQEPLIRLGLLAHRSVGGANAYNVLLGAAITSGVYFISLYLQRILGTEPALTGVEFLPFALGLVAGSVLAVKLGYRLAPRTLLVCGGLLTATGFAWLGQITAGGSFAVDVLGPSVLVSVGFGLCLGPVVSTGTIGVAADEAGVASGLLNSSRQIGASLGLAALGTAAAHRTASSGTLPALNAGYALGLTLSAALMLTAGLIALTILRRTPQPPVGPSPETVTSTGQLNPGEGSKR
jgi:predicted MFS family arabinose efflux permease